MKIAIGTNEVVILNQRGISVDPHREYTEDEVFDILEQVRDVEVFYAQDADTNKKSLRLANEYGDLADKIQNMIPEN